ncbi:MAG: sporulation protein YunB [Bacilli bacterium]|nr:sporulation protein YunB [Bacilli bacterium]
MKKKLKNIIFIISSVLVLSFFLIQISSKRINPILYNYINLEAERITSNIINGSVNEILSKEIDKNLFIIEKNKNEEIQIINYNTKEVNKLLKNISKNIQRKLILLEDGKLKQATISDTFKGKRFNYVKNGIVCEIPVGSLSNNGFIANMGPIIPIKMSFLGQINSNLETKVTNYGINNLYLEINVKVEVKEKVTMPKMSKNSTIKVTAPLTVKIIQGVVPEYYGGNLNQDSHIFSLPHNK